jgi:hypothetical protein
MGPACAVIGQRMFYSSIVLTHSQPPLNLSFHKLTRLSPVLIASALPLRLQLTRHAAASTSICVRFHSRRSEEVQMETVLS